MHLYADIPFSLLSKRERVGASLLNGMCFIAPSILRPDISCWLLQMYKKLQSQRRLREVLQSMYAWGKQHGWDPAALKEHLASNLPSPNKLESLSREW